MESKQGYSGPVTRGVRNFPNVAPMINSGRTAIAPCNIPSNSQVTPQNAIAPQPSPLGGNRTNMGGLKRYFGRDLTNLEDANAGTIVGADNKSHFKSSNRENTAGSQPKKNRPSPIAFFKGLFENQKHKLLKRRDTLMTDPDDTPADLPCNRRLHHSRERSLASQPNQQQGLPQGSELVNQLNNPQFAPNSSVVLTKPALRLAGHQPHSSEVPLSGIGRPDQCKQQVMPLVRSRRRDSKELPTGPTFGPGFNRGEVANSHHQIPHPFAGMQTGAGNHGASSDNVAGDYLSKLKKQSAGQNGEVSSQGGAFNTDHGYPTVQGLNSTRAAGGKISGLICSSIQAISKKSANKNSILGSVEAVNTADQSKKIAPFSGVVFPQQHRASFLSSVMAQEPTTNDLEGKGDPRLQTQPENGNPTAQHGPQHQASLIRSNSSIASRARRSFLNPKFKHLCLQIESGPAPTDVMLEEAIHPTMNGTSNNVGNQIDGGQSKMQPANSDLMMTEPLPSPDGPKPSVSKAQLGRSRSPPAFTNKSGLDLESIWYHLLSLEVSSPADLETQQLSERVLLEAPSTNREHAEDFGGLVGRRAPQVQAATRDLVYGRQPDRPLHGRKHRTAPKEPLPTLRSHLLVYCGKVRRNLSSESERLCVCLCRYLYFGDGTRDGRRHLEPTGFQPSLFFVSPNPGSLQPTE